MSTPYGSTGTTEEARKAALQRKDKPCGGTLIIAVIGPVILLCGFLLLVWKSL